MGVSTSLLLQSKFYSSAFNSALFDGPVRIYFAQYQEEQALKIHFQLQRFFRSLFPEDPVAFRKASRKIFVMLYPDHVSYIKAFPNEKGEPWMTAILGDDRLLGIQTPLSETKVEKISQLIHHWLQEAQADLVAVPTGQPIATEELAKSTDSN